MVNPKQPGHIVTLITLDTLYFFMELVSSHLHMKTQSTWATRLNTSPQFPSNKIHFGVPTTLEGKSHLEGETFPCIHQSQSHFHLNCAFGDMTLVLYPWDMLFSSFEHPTISHLPKRYPYSHNFLLSKNLGSQTNLPTNKKWQLQKIPVRFFWNISQFVGNFEHLELRTKTRTTGKSYHGRCSKGGWWRELSRMHHNTYIGVESTNENVSQQNFRILRLDLEILGITNSIF